MCVPPSRGNAFPRERKRKRDSARGQLSVKDYCVMVINYARPPILRIQLIQRTTRCTVYIGVYTSAAAALSLSSRDAPAWKLLRDARVRARYINLAIIRRSSLSVCGRERERDFSLCVVNRA